MVTWTHHQGRINYTSDSPETPLMPNHRLHGQPALLTKENCLDTQPDFLWFTPTTPCACHGEGRHFHGSGGCSHHLFHLNMTPHQPNHAGLPPQQPQALAEGPHGLVCLRHPQGLCCWQGTALQQRPWQCQAEPKGDLLFLAGHAGWPTKHGICLPFQTAPWQSWTTVGYDC